MVNLKHGERKVDIMERESAGGAHMLVPAWAAALPALLSTERMESHFRGSIFPRTSG